MDKHETFTDDLKPKGEDNKLVEQSRYPTVSGEQPQASIFGLLKDGRM